LFRSFQRWPLAPDHQDLADVLHRCGVKRRADARQTGLAFLAVRARHPHLYQLVAVQARVDLAQHRVGQPLVADRHHRVQAMRPGLERLALGGGEHALGSRI
jgi:hypothetical protein